MTLIAEVREKKLLIRISVNLPTPDHPLPAPPLSIIHSTKKTGYEFFILCISLPFSPCLRLDVIVLYRFHCNENQKIPL